MSYSTLSLNSFIKEIREVSDGAHPRRFCFILGAGASRTSGIKSGQELVKIWDRELRERNEEDYNLWRKKLKITDENMSSFYSQYYEKRFSRCRSDGYNFIEKIMESAKPSAGYVMLAHLLTHTPHNVVITTNFDHLTEDAVNYYAQSTPLVIGHESLSHYVSGQPVRPTIIKIHRDLLFDPKSRTEDLEKLHDNWKAALGLIFANYHPVFIGYAGNDKSLMDFLIENGHKFANDTWKYPYWLIYKTDVIDGKVKTFLENSDGFCIRHNGFDKVLIQLGAAFDYTIPTEDSFMEDARKRYKALADAIDALSDASKSSNVAEAISAKITSTDEFPKKPEEENTDENDTDEAIEKITSNTEMQRTYRDLNNLCHDGNYTEALKICEQLISIEPENPRYLGRYADILCNLERYDDAIIALKKVIQLDPENDWNYYLLGNALENNDQLEEALKNYSKAAELEPEEGFYYFCHASALYKLEEYERALLPCKKAVELEPESSLNHFLLADILNELNRYEEALPVCGKAIELDSQSDIYHYLMANLLLKTEQYEAALKSIQTAISLDENYSPSYNTLSSILRRLGRYDEAEEAKRKADAVSANP